MGNKALAWLIAGSILLLFVLIAWTLPGMLGLTGTLVLVLRGGLVLLGLVAAVLTLFALLARARARPQPEAVDDDIDLAFAAAASRLAASNITAESRIARLPLTLVLGPAGSAKSSAMTHGGLDAELLAGEVMRGDGVVPTDPVNIWYAQGTIIVEAGGSLLDDADRWARLMRHLRPNRLAAALGRRSQAPRTAIVCFPCDDFAKPGASQSLAAAARQLRVRLGEASQQLGIRLPVYMLFTRADRLPFFSDYVRSLSTEEAQQVVGATLPVGALPVSEVPGGSWAERESRRLNVGFNRLVDALAARRTELLPREAQDEIRAGAYEFPRELRKIVEPAVQLLIDMFRPSQLGLNPFLRGFYFTGVRPIVLRDSAAEPWAPTAAPAGRVDAGATSVFNPAMLQQQALHAAPPPAAGGRKVPQWLFLHRLFRDVVLRDDVALRITGGGTRVDLLRRGLIAGAAAAGVVLSLGFTVSYAGNRGLIRDSVAAASGALEIGSLPGALGAEDLTKLEALRERTAEVSGYERDGRPLLLAWGLYSGDDVHGVLRNIYFDRFGSTLWTDARDRFTGYLRALPERPDEDSEFGRAQDALAAYQLTTTEYRRSTPELLAPALLGFSRGTDGSEEALELASRQFEFFATELAYGNPYPAEADPALVGRSQAFLGAFGPEAYYRALIYETSSGIPPVRYAGPASIVSNAVVVPGSFTIAGWQDMQVNLDSVEHLFARYEWIYGSRAPADRPQRDELARRYEADYIAAWQAYLDGARVERFPSVAQAASRLNVLAASNSPLFAMLATASRETAMDSASAIGQAFQPLHATVAPDADPRAVTANAVAYANSMTTLSSNLNYLATAAGAAQEAAGAQAAAAAAALKTQVTTMATAFNRTAEAAVVAGHIQRLLTQPAQFAEDLVRSLPAAELNAAGRSFCSTVSPVLGRFPFNSQGQDADVDAVNAVFQPDGIISALLQDRLQPLMTSRGGARPGQNVRSEFARFMMRAVEFSNAVYGGGVAGGPEIAFDLQPEVPAGASEVLFELDGREVSYSPASAASRQFVWTAAQSTHAQLTAVINGERVTVASGDGPWSIFRLFQTGTWSDAGAGRHRVEWRVPGSDIRVVAFVAFESGVPAVLAPGYTRLLSQCVATISN